MGLRLNGFSYSNSNISGKLLKKQDINQNNNTVNTQELAVGTYIYKITSSKK
ncbi:T9SS type A sorting domain-containing protein [Chryseobacterium contaminans]|uniref:T9SS type A sorting domain-containing protein n=1 Tax=Chryseobacterium contaminans TaxID=1423959 RepID=UPI0009F71586